MSNRIKKETKEVAGGCLFDKNNLKYKKKQEVLLRKDDDTSLIHGGTL